MQALQDESQVIAKKIRSGEFFNESRAMYDAAVHDPMAERYFYLLVTALAACIFLTAIIAANGLYPLKVTAPFIVANPNLVDDVPNIRTLITREGEDPSAALLSFVLDQYVRAREEYQIDTFERNISAVRGHSTDEVFAEFERMIDPRNPASPVTLYQRHSVRRAQIYAIRPALSGPGLEILFETSIEGKNEVKRTRWQAGIVFDYSGVELDEETGAIKPFQFLVTQYKVKRLQDVR